MKSMKLLAFPMLLLLAASGFLYSQAQAPEQLPDLSGTWIGDTDTPNGTTTLTMVLAKKGDTYSGFLSDSLGMLFQTPIQSVKYEKGVMTFFFMVVTGTDELRVDSTVKLNNGRLSGEWVIGEGVYGSFILERKK